jgi:hypothetical protein
MKKKENQKDCELVQRSLQAMKVLHLPAEQALQYVTSRCFYRLDRSCMFLEQLFRWDPNRRTVPMLIN